MFFWISSNARCSLTHGIGQKHIYNTCNRLIVSRFAIIRIAMMIALFLPISRTHFYHHKMSDKQEDDQDPQLHDYHNFYENIPSSHVSNNMRFRHHKIKKKPKLLHKKYYQFDNVFTFESEFKFQHHPRLKNIIEQPLKPKIIVSNAAETTTQSPKTITQKADSESGIEFKKDRISDQEAVADDSISVIRGNTVTIPCKQGKNIISPGIVAWKYANGKLITAERFAVESDGSLVITNTLPSDSNVYVCEIEDNQQIQRVLKVCQPKVPALEISMQFEMDKTKYPIYNQSTGCKPSELITLKKRINEQLSDLCTTNECAITDLRISCQYILKNTLNIKTIIAAILTNEIINTCNDAQCMEYKMEAAVTQAKQALQNLLTNAKTEQRRTKLFETRAVTTCSGGYGLQDDNCMPCKPGYYSNEGSVDCIKCKPGSYQPDYGSSGCISCNQYGSMSGSTSEDNCHYKIISEILSNNLQVIIPLIIGFILSLATIAWILCVIIT